MKNRDTFAEKRLKRLKISMYLTPAIGLIPALWRLYRKEGDREERSVYRLSVNLALTWLITYILLWLGATETPAIVTFRLLYLNGLLSSGYFLVCIILMVRILQGKSITLPKMKQNEPEKSRKNMS